MGANCAPLVADLFLFCYGNDFMMSLPYDTQADIIEALNSTSEIFGRPFEYRQSLLWRNGYSDISYWIAIEQS